MARAQRRTKLRTTTAARPRRKPKASAPSSNFSSPLVFAVSAFLLLGLLWFYWPTVMGPQRGPVNPAKIKDLATQHPDAEVFELDDNLKKKP